MCSSMGRIRCCVGVWKRGLGRDQNGSADGKQCACRLIAWNDITTVTVTVYELNEDGMFK